MEKLKENFLPALLHVLYNLFVYYLFILPFDLWVNAVNRLSEQKNSGSLNITKISSPWPFLSFIKRFLLEFLFDGFIMLAYVLGPLIAILMLIISKTFGVFISVIVFSYYMPVILSLNKDFIALMVLPIKKFISWASKPAQFLDLEIKNK